jgi:hypothetical protein
MSNAMSNAWPIARDGARFAARDLAMLDTFIEAALAEGDDGDDLARDEDRVGPEKGLAVAVPTQNTVDVDNTDAFMQRTLAFLTGRADRLQLLERLRDAIVPPEAPPATDMQADAIPPAPDAE